MKRIVLLIILISQLHYLSFATDDNNYLFFNLEENYSGNLSINLHFLTMLEENPGVLLLGALLTSTFSVGGGWHLNIIPHFLSPGIYAECGLSLLSLLTAEGNNDGANNDAKKINEEPLFFGSIGIRLYNQFRYNIFIIQPFAGFNFTGGFSSSDSIGGLYNAFGILLAIDEISLEYSYNIPLLNNNMGTVHRFSLGLHFDGLK
ncbi:MAG: hypothetical protein LBI28_01650 [Treponema sp.]|jgi:hypothetical protein|nr:hypothetical protein [Treponema sp.]